MSDFSVNVDVDEVMDLAKGISKSLKSILESNKIMKQNLRTLGITFQDEGFEKVCGMVINSEKCLNEAGPDLSFITGQLFKYVEYLCETTEKL